MTPRKLAVAGRIDALAFITGADRIQLATEKNKRRRARYQENKVKILAQNKQWAIQNPEKKRASDVSYQLENAEKIKVQRAAFRAENKDRIVQADNAYKDKNRSAIAEKAKAYAKNNPEKVAALNKRWKAENPQSVAEISRRYRDKTPPAVASAARKVKRLAMTHEVKANFAQRSRARYAAQRNRTPPWVSPDDDWMTHEIFHLAALRSKATGIGWSVDHVVPMQGRLVSGLHVPWNLQAIPTLANIRKNNTMPSPDLCIGVAARSPWHSFFKESKCVH